MDKVQRLLEGIEAGDGDMKVSFAVVLNGRFEDMVAFRGEIYGVLRKMEVASRNPKIIPRLIYQTMSSEKLRIVKESEFVGEGGRGKEEGS